MAEQEAKRISMKLLINNTQNKVLYAEAGKECVDFILRFLSLPLGTVARFPTEESMPGSIGSLYRSLESLGNEYMQQGINKDCLLNPMVASGSASNVPLLTSAPAPDDPGAKTSYYACNNNCDHAYVSDSPEAKCPSCGRQMNQEVTYVAPPAPVKKIEESGGGYVKGMVTYMIMDDLSVQPMSTIASIMLLNKVKEQDLEEKEVTLDKDKEAALLKKSLVSKTVLTDVFLPKKSATYAKKSPNLPNSAKKSADVN